MRDRKNTGSRQTLYLFLVFLILFALSFTLGVIVGKGLGGSENTQMTREGIPLEFSRKEVVEHEKETDRDTKEEPIPESTPSPLKEEAKTEDAEITDEPSVQQTPSTSTSKEEIAEQAPVPAKQTDEAEGLIEQKTAPFEQPKEKTESEAAKVEEQIPTISTSKEQTATTQSETEKVEQKKLATLPTIEPGGRYTVQIGSFQEESKAKQIVDSLKSKGYPVFIKQVDIPGEGTRYRARVGTFKTREDAGLYGDDLKNREPDIVKLVFVTINN